MAQNFSTGWPRKAREPLLRVPPFPGAKGRRVSTIGRSRVGSADATVDIQCCVDVLRDARVGGTFWGAQPLIARSDAIIARPASPEQAGEMLAYAETAHLRARLILWLPTNAATRDVAGWDAVSSIFGECDPWYLFAHCASLWLDVEDENRLLARIAGVPVVEFGKRPAGSLKNDAASLSQHAGAILLDDVGYVDPFTGLPTDLASTIALLKYWRDLIDGNRPIKAAFGFAYWKKSSVEPLLWSGAPVHFLPGTRSSLDALQEDDALAIWKSRVSSDFLGKAEDRDGRLYEVEDGFIRSAGLGADCVPPLSIVVDQLGVHFDPAQPSELEDLLQSGEFSPDMLLRAERLRKLIVETGVSKYGAGGDALARPGGERRHILVTGQVEDDRSVLSGGGDVSGNLDLLKRARTQEPDAYIIYKPHPDVEAGHRKGRIPDAEALAFADHIIRDAPISTLLDMVDGVHVLTSLAGFEALIRGKQVTTHGVPFYAGWGLTTDLGAVPVRRTARRDVIEMVAAVLLIYPRYLDPVTALPCPPEVLVKRLAEGIRKENWAIVSLRRLQGSARQKLSKIGITI